MSTVEEWLGPGLFKALGPYLEDDLGVEEVDDIRMLEETHLSKIRGMLKPMPLKKFNLKYAELMGEASSAPTLAQLSSIPEGVAERPVAAVSPELRAVRRVHSAGSGEAAVALPVGSGAQTALSLDGLSIQDFLSAYCIFGSMRFPVPEEARLLYEALKGSGVHLKIVDMKAGQDIDAEVYSWIEHCDTFFVFGTKSYGEDTGNSACTYNEVKFAQAKRKNIILLRMIPWDDEFSELQARVLFNRNMLTLEWQQGQPMPPTLTHEILKAMSLPMDGPGGASPVHVASVATATLAEATAAKARAEAEAIQAQEAIAATAKAAEDALLAQRKEIEQQAEMLRRRQSELYGQATAMEQSEPTANARLAGGSAGERAVEFTDQDGDTVRFVQAGPQRVDYFVNGMIKVSHLTYVRWDPERSTFVLDGTAAGAGMSQKNSCRVTAPGKKVAQQIRQQILELWVSTNPAVAYTDTDGDEIKFILSAPGRMDYHVNGKLKVSGVNSLSMKKGVIHLDGSGVGEGMRPEQSRRVTAPGMKVRDQVYASIVNLYYSGQ